ncbi:hypothetical protein RFI_00062, partial [Reticulomyxa filosa]
MIKNGGQTLIDSLVVLFNWSSKIMEMSEYCSNSKTSIEWSQQLKIQFNVECLQMMLRCGHPFIPVMKKEYHINYIYGKASKKHSCVRTKGFVQVYQCIIYVYYNYQAILGVCLHILEWSYRITQDEAGKDSKSDKMCRILGVMKSTAYDTVN